MILLASLSLQSWNALGDSMRATLASSVDSPVTAASAPQLGANQQAGALSAALSVGSRLTPRIVDDLVQLGRAMELYDERALGISKLYSDTSHYVESLEKPTRWLMEHADLSEQDALALERAFLAPDRKRDWRALVKLLHDRLGIQLDDNLHSADVPFAQKVIAANVIRSADIDVMHADASTKLDVASLRRALDYAYPDVPAVFRDLYASWLAGARAPYRQTPADAWAGVVNSVRTAHSNHGTLQITFLRNYDFFLPPPAPRRALEGRGLELAKELWSALGQRTDHRTRHLRRDFQGNVELTEEAFRKRLDVLSRILEDESIPERLREVLTTHQEQARQAYDDARRLAQMEVWSKNDVQAHNAALAKLRYNFEQAVDHRQMPIVTTGSSEYYSFRDLVGSDGVLIYETPISTKEAGAAFRDHDLDHHHLWGTEAAPWWHEARKFAERMGDPTVEDYVLAVRWEGGAAPEHSVEALLRPPRRQYFDAPELSETQREALDRFRAAYWGELRGTDPKGLAAVAYR